LPDPFLVLRGKGLVITPRPGVPAVVELAVSPTGEVEGVLNSPENTPLPGVTLELVDDHGQVVAQTVTEYDGFFLFERVVYGRYRLQLAQTSEHALGLALAGDAGQAIVVSSQQTVDRLGTLRLHAATGLIAQARGPPVGGSP
jgi:hypothetical protein